MAYVIEDLNGEKIVGTFYEKKLQKKNNKEFKNQKKIKKSKRIEKVIRRKVINYILNGKTMIILF